MVVLDCDIHHVAIGTSGIIIGTMIIYELIYSMNNIYTHHIITL